MSALFHADIYIPPHLKSPCFWGPLKYTMHAQRAARNDRYGLIALPRELDVTKAQLIEVEADDGPGGKLTEVVKQVWRTALDEKRDIVLAIAYGGNVKTVWVNLRDDLHKTLDESKYVAKPPPRAGFKPS